MTSDLNSVRGALFWIVAGLFAFMAFMMVVNFFVFGAWQSLVGAVGIGAPAYSFARLAQMPSGRFGLQKFTWRSYFTVLVLPILLFIGGAVVMSTLG